MGMRVCVAGTCRADLSEAERTEVVDASAGRTTHFCPQNLAQGQESRCGDSELRFLPLQGQDPHRNRLMEK